MPDMLSNVQLWLEVPLNLHVEVLLSKDTEMLSASCRKTSTMLEKAIAI
jgi:hypothetical protein